MKRSSYEALIGKKLYKAYANKLTRVKNLSKKMYYKQSILEKSKTLKNFGNLLIQSFPRNAQTRTPIIPFEIIINDCSLNNPQKVAQSFNDYFVKIGQSIDSIDDTKFPSFKTYNSSKSPFTH